MQSLVTQRSLTITVTKISMQVIKVFFVCLFPLYCFFSLILLFLTDMIRSLLGYIQLESIGERDLPVCLNCMHSSNHEKLVIIKYYCQ